MRLRRIELFHVAVPLRSKIAHASHQRVASDNLIVRATLDDGTTGYGEGVPREYVTGETIETCFGALRRFDAAEALGAPADWPGVVRSLERLELPETREDARGMAGNAARCGLELALLDACGRRLGVTMGEAVRGLGEASSIASEAPHGVRYSGAITAASEKKERISAWKMRIYGFAQVKIKVGVAGQDDASRLGRLRSILGKRCDIRLDANEAWGADEAVANYAPLRRFGATALEQPIAHAEVGRLAEMRPRLGVAVMLDESLCGWPDGVRAVKEGLCDVFNVRLSKCGGLIPSLRLLALAERAGLESQLGCHPGETGILSAAGRQVASNVKRLRYLEGSYDKHVVRENVIEEEITFGYGGRAPALTGAGLGVTVDRERLERLTVRREEVDFGG